MYLYKFASYRFVSTQDYILSVTSYISNQNHTNCHYNLNKNNHSRRYATFFESNNLNWTIATTPTAFTPTIPLHCHPVRSVARTTQGIIPMIGLHDSLDSAGDRKSYSQSLAPSCGLALCILQHLVTPKSFDLLVPLSKSRKLGLICLLHTSVINNKSLLQGYTC